MKLFLDYLVVLFSLLVVCPSKTLKKKPEKEYRNCPDPALLKNGTQLPTENVVDLHREVSEVKFDGALGKLDTKRSCKLKCVNGEWVGPLCLEEGVTGDGKFQPVLKGCTSLFFEQNFIVSYKNKTQLTPQDYPHGTNIQVRCKRFGIYKLIGDSRLSCHNGLWKNKIPACIPTTSINNLTDDSSPPSILIKLTAGSASIEPTGELAVYPGSILHLECLFSRSFGVPEWSWTSSYGNYPTGWSIEAKSWKFILSIYYIKTTDTGIYTCSTPKGLTHSIILNVIAVNCDTSKITSTDPYMNIKVEGSRLGHSSIFTCHEGFRLNGTSNITCQASGTWSGYIPNCLPVVCPNLNITDANIKLVQEDNHYGGRAVFECPYGYKLIGAPSFLCRDNGTWSDTVQPTCKEITCAQPMVPTNGRIDFGNETASPRYKVGTSLRFYCNDDYQIVGEDTIMCSDTGYWSNPPPFCKIRCVRPGDPVNGRFTPDKPSYDIGERLTVTCNYGHEPSFPARPRCQRNGTWLELDVECRIIEHFIFTTALYEITTSIDINTTTETA